MLNEYQIDSYNQQISQSILERLKFTIEIKSHLEEDWTGAYGDKAPAVHLWVVTSTSIEEVAQIVALVNAQARVFDFGTVQEDGNTRKDLKHFEKAFSNLHCAIKPEDDANTYALLSENEYQQLIEPNAIALDLAYSLKGDLITPPTNFMRLPPETL